MKCSTFQWSKNLDNIIIVLTRSLMIDQRNERPFVKLVSHPRPTCNKSQNVCKQYCLLMLQWKKWMFMNQGVWIRPHYNSRSKILKFSKWKYYRWWSIRAPLILLHPNHPYSSNPIPPKSSSFSLHQPYHHQFTGSKIILREYRHRMKIFNILLASKAVFGAEKCHLPVSFCIKNFLSCTFEKTSLRIKVDGPESRRSWKETAMRKWMVLIQTDHLFDGHGSKKTVIWL